MTLSWADVVREFKRDDGRAWADDVSSSSTSSEEASPPGVPGDPVGLRAVQSILMSATQMNLSHFHTAGMSVNLSSRPAPTAAEAMNHSYANTSMTFRCSLDAYELRKRLVGATFKSFLVTVGSSMTLFPDHENVWYETSGKEMHDGIVIRFYMDYVKMRDHGLTLQDLALTFGSNAVTSPDFMGMIDVEVPDYMSQWISRTGNRVCGTTNIKSCDKVDDVTAVATGTDVLAVSRTPSVDKRSVTSNNIVEVEKHFGIEAAAGVLNELISAGNCTAAESRVVSDFMARTGKVLPFTKSSVEVGRKGLLTSMGFERPKEDIKKPATHPRAFTSVYECIMTGVDPR